MRSANPMFAARATRIVALIHVVRAEAATLAERPSICRRSKRQPENQLHLRVQVGLGGSGMSGQWWILIRSFRAAFSMACIDGERSCWRCHNASAAGRSRPDPSSCSPTALSRSEEETFSRVSLPRMLAGTPRISPIPDLDEVCDLVICITSLERPVRHAEGSN